MYANKLAPLALLAACLTGCAVEPNSDPSTPAPTAASETPDMYFCTPRWTPAETVTVVATSPAGRGYARSISESSSYGTANCAHAYVVDFVVPDPIPGFYAGVVPTWSEQGASGVQGSFGGNGANLSAIKTAADCATYHFETTVYGESAGALTLLTDQSAGATWDATHGICVQLSPTIMQTTSPNGYVYDHFRIGIASFAVVAGTLTFYPVESAVFAGG